MTESIHIRNGPRYRRLVGREIERWIVRYLCRRSASRRRVLAELTEHERRIRLQRELFARTRDYEGVGR